MKNPLTEEEYLRRSNPRTPDIRGDYFRDQTAIIHSTAFRRLKHKTQVFFAPANDHICTRIEHVLHVGTIASAICKGLNMQQWNLNPDMAYAIGLGHDLGHTPFGHAGEKAIENYLGNRMSFYHEMNSYRIVEWLANQGKGLNLTYGVKDGIVCHNGERDEQFLKPDPVFKNLPDIRDRKVIPSSFEGCIVRMSDKIAYLGRDVEDAIQVGVIEPGDIPYQIASRLGTSNSKIISELVADLIEYSKDKDHIGFSDEVFGLMRSLKKFNYENIYFHETVQTYEKFCDNMIARLYNHLEELFNKNKHDYDKYTFEKLELDISFGQYLRSMEEFYRSEGSSALQQITDYISGMTDNFCLNAIQQISIPKPITIQHNK
ncbi:MAG: HD domain-containing protein [Bacteroidales bacterium]|nr:HD domain-containing protein [Bacteroidales bacterium]